jgi:hypothetical protein
MGQPANEGHTLAVISRWGRQFISVSLDSGTFVPSNDIHHPEIAEILFPSEKEISPVSGHAAHSSATAAEDGHLALAGSVD